MTTANPEEARDRAASQIRAPRVGSWLSALREALDRPLTTYYLLIGASMLLLTIGLIMVLSASSVYSYDRTGDSYTIVRRQLLWVLIGVPGAADRQPGAAPVGTPAGLPGVLDLPGPAADHGPLRHRDQRQHQLARPRAAPDPAVRDRQAVASSSGPPTSTPTRTAGSATCTRSWSRWCRACCSPPLLVIVGKDLGTALIFFALLLGMLWVVGAPARFFVLCISVVSVGVFALATADSERFARITTFVDPFKDFHDTGWQPAHGLYAMSTGGIFGQGIGASQQKWGALPEAHTDFIFAVLGEELGLVGTLLVIALFLSIAYAALRVAREAKDPFVRYTSFGIVVWLIGQMIINVGMVLALLPVIGIPLPLVSYGGSSLLPTLAALGLLVGFARREPAAARALAQRRRSRSARR